MTDVVCNSLILGASVAPISILEHLKFILSTLASTLEKLIEEVAIGSF
jgi:hypothetical protein